MRMCPHVVAARRAVAPRLARVAAAVGTATLLAAPAGATAAPAPQACAGAGPVSTFLRDGLWLESSIFDGAGRFVYTDTLTGKITALDSPTAPRRRLGRVLLPGGMARTPDGRLALASGNTWSRVVGGGAVYLLDPATGGKQRIASQLVGANGLARADDGTIYTSDEYGAPIDRISPAGTVEIGWWKGRGGANGLALTPDGLTLYANLTLAGRIVAIDTATGANRTVYRVPGSSTLPDGLALDRAGLLYVTLYGAGQVIRVDPQTGAGCRLASGLTLPTSVAIPPASSPFDAGSIYVTTWGAVKRIPAAVPAPATP